jgi:FAD/FMN-containing dehydrogenase
MGETPATALLAERLRGRVIRPCDREYDAARRVWNGRIDRFPALVVRCAGTADVIAAVDHARDHELPLTVRGGGHGVIGDAVRDGGVVLDLAELRAVRVDPQSRTARVGAGATWGVVDHETQAFGLAVTGGADSRTGVGGVTLGGGIGYLARPFGLTIDNLVSAQVVLEDGRVVTADDDEHPDLFWALRGGGGALGVVTWFEYRLHSLGPEVMTAQVLHRMDAAAEVLAFYRGFVAEAPDEVACYAHVAHVPSADRFPPELHGRTALVLVGCHAGSLEEGRAAFAPLAAFGDPLHATIAPMPYGALQSLFDARAPAGGRYALEEHVLDALSDDAIGLLVDRIDPLPGPYSAVSLEPLGGAVSRVDASATAFPHRGARFWLRLASGWASAADDDRALAWTRLRSAAMAPFATTAVHADDRGEGAAIEACVGRLREIERRYDPDGVFGRARRVPAGA